MQATIIANLNETELKGLPTDSLITEEDLSKFDRLAKEVNSRNYSKPKVLDIT